MNLCIKRKSKLGMLLTGYNALIKPDRVRKFPPQLNIEITTACNLSCKSCSRKFEVKQPSHMTFEQFQKILLKVKPSLICLVGFGEPMLHPEFFRFVRFANSMGISVSVTTNGTLISNFVSEIIQSGLHTLTVSLDAPNEELYSRVRHNHLFKKVIQGIEEFTKKKQELKIKTPVLVFHYVIYNENYKEVADFVKFSKKHNPSMVFFQPFELYVESDRSILINGMTKEKLYKSLSKARHIAMKENIFTNLDFWLRDFKYIWLRYEGTDIKPISRRPCVRPWISSYISVCGEVIPCCALATKSKYVAGNIFQKEFEVIWNSKKYIQFRRNINKGIKSYSGCRDCIPLTIWDKYRNFSKRNMATKTNHSVS